MNTTLMNSVNWHVRWSSVMCAGLIAFMLFGMFLSTGCSITFPGRIVNPPLPSPKPPKASPKPPKASLPNAACVVGSGDTDGDGILDTIDVDRDGDGLIEICTLGELHNIRYNLTGTSYKTQSSGSGDSSGCGGTNAVTVCNGYELLDDLSFDTGNNGTWSTTTGVYSLDTNDNADPYFVVSEGGWKPIGEAVVDSSGVTCDGCFNAIFEGNDHTITGLAIRRDASGIGMFGATEANADIRNIGLVNNLTDYTGSGSSDSIFVGGLVGFQEGGSITASYTTGTVNGGAGDNLVGGLVGYQEGSITASYTTGTVNRAAGTTSASGNFNTAGGLVGLQGGSGSITASYTMDVTVNGGGAGGIMGGLVGIQKESGSASIIASYTMGGTINGKAGDDGIGGLVGLQRRGSIIASYTMGGTVVNGGAGDDVVGGLVGLQSEGSITASYATGGTVVNGGAGDDVVGGLVGLQNDGGSTTVSYATGIVNGNGGTDNVGGLIGLQDNGSITASYATGGVNGGNDVDYVGGLVGRQYDSDYGGSGTYVPSTGSITASYATGTVNGGDGTDTVGGLIGLEDSGTDAIRITASYGFGTATGEADGGYGVHPSINTGTAMMRAAMLTSSNAGMSWDTATKNTLGAWSFATGKIPALKYADYDGTVGTAFYCEGVTPPTPTMGTSIPIPSCGTLISGQ